MQELNFKLSLRAELIKPYSSFTEQISYDILDKFSVMPENPTSIQDFTSHYQQIDIPYSGFIKKLIVDQISHTSALQYSLSKKMFPMFFIHGLKEPYKVPFLDETTQQLTYADYTPSMFDLNGQYPPRFLINFASEQSIPQFLYNFEPDFSVYFEGIKSNTLKFTEINERFKDIVTAVLPYSMTYLDMLTKIYQQDSNFTYSHSEDRMFFNYADTDITVASPINNNGLLKTFQRNFKDFNIENSPSNDSFMHNSQQLIIALTPSNNLLTENSYTDNHETENPLSLPPEKEIVISTDSHEDQLNSSPDPLNKNENNQKQDENNIVTTSTEVNNIPPPQEPAVQTPINTQNNTETNPTTPLEINNNPVNTNSEDSYEETESDNIALDDDFLFSVSESDAEQLY